LRIFAQEDPETPTELLGAEAQPVDPITAAERALTLEDGGAGAAQPVPATSALGIFRVILTLAVVAAAIYGIVFFIRRMARGRAAQDPFLKTLASIPLGVSRSAHIISVGSRAWLVGSAESGINLISEIDDKDVLNEMLLENSRKSAESPAGRFPDFRTLLGRLGMKVESSEPSPESIRKRSERLRNQGLGNRE
jgi:flagellar protein FliO/FliZ